MLLAVLEGDASPNPILRKATLPATISSQSALLTPTQLSPLPQLKLLEPGLNPWHSLYGSAYKNLGHFDFPMESE